MTSRREARRRRKAAKELPKLAPVEKPKQHRVDGRFARDEDPREVALTARTRRMSGLSMKDAADPMLTCELGCVIHSKCKPDEAARLWSVWQAYCAAERTYRIRIIGTTGDPQGAAIQMIPDTLQADPSFRADTRTDDEKDRDAVNNWMRWQGYLGHLGAREASALRQAERGTGKPLWASNRATQAGSYAFSALRCLAEITQSERKRFR